MTNIRGHNLAFIDAQNLHFGTTKCEFCAKKLNIDTRNIRLADCVCGAGWQVDLHKFKVYLAISVRLKPQCWRRLFRTLDIFLYSTLEK